MVFLECDFLHYDFCPDVLAFHLLISTVFFLFGHASQTQIPDIWVSGLDLQPMMLESIVTLIRETLPRWRQMLLGLPEDSAGGLNVVGGCRGAGGAERSLSGGSGAAVGGSGGGIGGGPTGPGGPPQIPTAGPIPAAPDFLMSGTNISGTLGPSLGSNNPSSSIQALNIDVTSVGVSRYLL